MLPCPFLWILLHPRITPRIEREILPDRGRPDNGLNNFNEWEGTYSPDVVTTTEISPLAT